jgi:NAD-dependent DNA ligase
MNANPFTPDQVVKAHQYLYYIGPSPIWSDYEYDQYCSLHCIDGKGGSDCERDYSSEEKKLAKFISKNGMTGVRVEE